MKKIMSSLLAGLLVTSFAQAADTYIAQRNVRNIDTRDTVTTTTTTTTTRVYAPACPFNATNAQQYRLARNYRGGWNDGWSHPEWCYYHEIWGTASTLDVLSDPDSAYKRQSSFYN